MINIRFTGVNEILNGLKGVAQEASRPDVLLDAAARDTKAKMMAEAPKGLTGRLAQSIQIIAPNVFTRIIEPLAQYALAVEGGTGPSGAHAPYYPNLQNLANYYGVPLFIGSRLSPLVLAIASTIKNRGTPAQPFVFETYAWVEGQIDKFTYPFLEKISARYQAG